MAQDSRRLFSGQFELYFAGRGRTSLPDLSIAMGDKVNKL